MGRPAKLKKPSVVNQDPKSQTLKIWSPGVTTPTISGKDGQSTSSENGPTSNPKKQLAATGRTNPAANIEMPPNGGGNHKHSFNATDPNKPVLKDFGKGKSSKGRHRQQSSGRVSAQDPLPTNGTLDGWAKRTPASSFRKRENNLDAQRQDNHGDYSLSDASPDQGVLTKHKTLTKGKGKRKRKAKDEKAPTAGEAADESQNHEPQAAGRVANMRADQLLAMADPTFARASGTIGSWLEGVESSVQDNEEDADSSVFIEEEPGVASSSKPNSSSTAHYANLQTY